MSSEGEGKKSSGVFKTGDTEFGWVCPQDPRFGNTNQTKWCYTMFVDYQRCTRLLGTGFESCDFFKRCYNSICPNEWVAKWTQQIEDGCFPVVLPPVKESEDSKEKK